MTSPPDVIVAPATPAGTGALAIVRLSGAGAEEVADRMFRGRRTLSSTPSHFLTLGLAVDPRFDDEPIDEVMAVVMRAPKSPTGETVVELSSHGSPEITAALVDVLVATGARPAAAGEFTRRAFLNGRIDLAQAEAISELVWARGRRARRNAMAQLRGGISERLGVLRGRLLDELAPLEAFIDFGDDVPEAPGQDRLLDAITEVRAGLARLLGGRERARLMRCGATVALAGRPNVGKSSLLNAMAGEERALVHAEPGTTRDLVDADISIGGYAVRLVDTAGIRNTTDPVEAAGVDRARRIMEEADVTLLVLEAPTAPFDDDRRIAETLEPARMMVVRNKIDLGDDDDCRRFAETCAGGAPVVPVSARRGDGLDQLIGQISGRLRDSAGDEEGVILTAARHLDAMERADNGLARAALALSDGAWADMVAAELRESLSALGEITGEQVGPEILDRIFSRFCIGK